jgi:hypothetical protein
MAGPTNEAAAAGVAASTPKGTSDGLPELAQELMAKASDMSSAMAEQHTQPTLRQRQEHTSRLLEAATQQAEDAGISDEEPDVQLALMAAEMRVPSETLASALQQGHPLPTAALPHSSPGKVNPSAHLQQNNTMRRFSDSGSWDQASRANSTDSGWESVGPLGAPQGSWEWFGSRGSIGSSGGFPSNLRPVDEGAIAERRRQGYVSLDAGNSDGTLGGDKPRRRSASSVPGFTGAAGPDLQQATAAAHAAATFRRVSDSESPSSGLPPPAAPPNIRRPSSGAAGSDAIRRASFGRAAAVHNAAVTNRSQLRALAERPMETSQDSAPGNP